MALSPIPVHPPGSFSGMVRLRYALPQGQGSQTHGRSLFDVAQRPFFAPIRGVPVDGNHDGPRPSVRGLALNAQMEPFWADFPNFAEDGNEGRPLQASAVKQLVGRFKKALTCPQPEPMGPREQERREWPES